MTENPGNAPLRQPESGAGDLVATAEADDALPRRTDPRTFVVQALQVVPRSILPLVAVAIAMRNDGVFGPLMIFGIIVAILAINMLFTFLRWWRQTYRVGESDIRLETGVLSRAARSVPYDRIQDVSLEQGFIPRLFGLTEVKFETGAGGSDEIKLAYLSNEEGARLRELVREMRDELDTPTTLSTTQATEAAIASREEEAAPVLFSMGPKRLFVFGLFEFSLALVAFLGAAAQQFDFLLPFDIWDVKTWQGLLAGPGEQIAHLGLLGQILGAVAAVVSLLVVGMLSGIVRTFLRDWDFRLERTSKGFRRRRGMFTRTDVVMPVHRVQAVQIATGVVRHRFGWKSLKLVSLAQDSGDSSHVVAPFAKSEELTPILKVSGFPLPTRGLEWHRTAASFRVVSALFAVVGYAALAVGAAILALQLQDQRYSWLWVAALLLAGLRPGPRAR